jgi:hypothetical protein
MPAAARVLVVLLALLAPVARAAPPVLVATQPPAGATGVSPLLAAFSIAFDQPMANQGSLSITGPWPGGELLFIGDRVFSHSRGDVGVALPGGATITITVNPPGSTRPFVNLAGEPAATTTFSFTIAPGTEAPSVVSTAPPRGAIGVDPRLGAIVVRFSEPMDPNFRSFTLPGTWGTSSVSWSPDLQTLTILRDDTSRLLPARDLVTLVLNPPGSANSFRDFDGNPLPETRIAFGVEPYEHFPAVVATDPPNGAVGVAASRTSFTVTFDEPMADAVSLGTSPRWGASTTSWSADGRTLTVTRQSVTPLEADSRIQVDLNVTPGAVDWLFPPAFLRNLRGDRLPAYSFSFQVAPQADPPRVTATVPANGAVHEDPHLALIAIHFDRPMALGTCSGLSTSGDEWGDPDGPPVFNQWSADRRTFYVVRNNPQTLLRAGQEITIRLNPQECSGDPNFLFRSQAGALLGAYTFTFTIGDGENRVYAVPADPEQGFSWPYYLGVPPGLAPDAALLVEPNNTGTASNDLAVHDRAAEAHALGRANHAEAIGVPWLVPVFPRPATPPLYTHALDRDTLLTTEPGLQRLDLQLVAMLTDARRRLAERGLRVAPRVLLNGFSASGAFAHRFAVLHPGLVQAVASGSGAGWPIAPVAAWGGMPLRYPVGVADLADLVGAPLAETAYRRVPLYLYVGDLDDNDPVPGWPPIDRDAVFALTGVTSGPIWPRWVVSEAIHRGVGMTRAEFAVYADVGHTVSAAMNDDVTRFLSDALPEPRAGLAGLAAAAALAGLARRRGRSCVLRRAGHSCSRSGLSPSAQNAGPSPITRTPASRSDLAGGSPAASPASATRPRTGPLPRGRCG